MGAQPYTLKDPATTKSYTFDRSVLLAPGAKLSASSWELSADLTKVSDGFDADAGTTAIVVSGGILNTDYTLYNTFTADDGQSYRVAFLLRVVDAVYITEPSELEKQLSALRVALGEKAAKDTEEYQIANRMKRAYSFEDLLNWEKRLTELVNAERRQAGGSGFFKNHYVRPVEPGP